MKQIQRILSAQGRRTSPLIGIVAGSGLVARGAVDAGADLLFVMNAGLYRNQGGGSFAAFLPFGNANDQTEALLREHILPRRGPLPVVAGVMATDPTCSLDERLARLKRLGVNGIVNWPTVGFVDGRYRAALEAEGCGIAAELAMLLRAREMGFATFGFSVSGDRTAGRFAAAGADALILGLGLTHAVEDIRQRRDQLQKSITVLNAMLDDVRRSGCAPAPRTLAFGGPITMPEDLEQVLAHSEIDGFAGGSVFERLPLQNTLTALVRRYKSLSARPGDVAHAGGFGAMVGACDAMRELHRRVERVAPFDVNVYIQGESGTGKELVAVQLHRLGLRRQRAFVTLNCGAIPDGLLESELFGHEKGAFTGADRRRAGKFELAHGGILFLDEVADLSPHGQVALLRALQEREITPVGGDAPRPVDVRVLSASNRPLAELVDQGRFRADLYYRLNGVTIELPPLRQRLDDLPLLVEHVLGRLRIQFDRNVRGASPEFFRKLHEHAWPGNIRELEHVLSQAVMFEEGHVLTGMHFQPLAPRAAGDPGETRRAALQRALLQAGGNKSRAAEILGVTRRTLYAWLRDAAEEGLGSAGGRG